MIHYFQYKVVNKKTCFQQAPDLEKLTFREMIVDIDLENNLHAVMDENIEAACREV